MLEDKYRTFKNKLEYVINEAREEGLCHKIIKDIVISQGFSLYVNDEPNFKSHFSNADKNKAYVKSKEGLKVEFFEDKAVCFSESGRAYLLNLDLDHDKFKEKVISILAKESEIKSSQ